MPSGQSRGQGNGSGGPPIASITVRWGHFCHFSTCTYSSFRWTSLGLVSWYFFKVAARGHQATLLLLFCFCKAELKSKPWTFRWAHDYRRFVQRQSLFTSTGAVITIDWELLLIPVGETPGTTEIWRCGRNGFLQICGEGAVECNNTGGNNVVHFCWWASPRIDLTFPQVLISERVFLIDSRVNLLSCLAT